MFSIVKKHIQIKRSLQAIRAAAQESKQGDTPGKAVDQRKPANPDSNDGRQPALGDKPVSDVQYDHTNNPPSTALLGDLPDSSNYKLESEMELLSAEGKWVSRKIIFCDQNIFLCRLEDRLQLKDVIPLTDIVSANKVENAQNILRQAGAPLSLQSVFMNTDHSHCLELITIPGGYNSGRRYYFKFFSDTVCTQWIREIQEWKVKIHKESLGRFPFNQIEPLRLFLKNIYAAQTFQLVIALFICANFITTISQYQIDDSDSDSLNALNRLDIFFSTIFAAELLINIFIHWWRPFLQDGWNLFDLIVVTVSLVSLGSSDWPGLNQLRLLRAFRVVRLFGRLKSLRLIINGLTASTIPVGNSLLIMLLVTAIFAILATNLFGSSNPKYFGTFSSAMFTMFQVCTGDGWATDIVRPMLSDSAGSNFGIILFFVFFIVLVSWILLQVVVAVLLENFMSANQDEKENQKKATQSITHGSALPVHVIDPLMTAISNFDSATTLGNRIRALFQLLDTDDGKSLSFVELREGLRKMKVQPTIEMTHEDFYSLTDEGALCNANGEIGADEFEVIMRKQFKLFIQRKIEKSMQDVDDSYANPTRAILLALKVMSINSNDLSSKVADVESSLDDLLASFQCPHRPSNGTASIATTGNLGKGGAQQSSRNKEKRDDNPAAANTEDATRNAPSQEFPVHRLPHYEEWRYFPREESVHTQPAEEPPFFQEWMLSPRPALQAQEQPDRPRSGKKEVQFEISQEDADDKAP